MQITDHFKAKREKFYADFVSVKDLINHFESSCNDGVDVIASALLTFFEELNQDERPRYGFADDINMSFNEVDRKRESKHLDNLLSKTASGGGLSDVSDHFGWMRQELFSVFSAKGFSVPSDLPQWTGVSKREASLIKDSSSELNGEGYEWLDDPLLPEELSIAITAWNAARVNAEQSGKRVGEFIRDWLKDHHPELPREATIRIAIVANWDKKSGRAKRNR